jgi:glutathione peroxidase
MKNLFLVAFSFISLMSLFGFLLPPNTLFDFTVKNIDEQEVSLSKYKGKVILVVNTASKCGLTPQYEDLQKLYVTYQNQGLEILAFPSNDFLRQEPAGNSKIKEFCASTYKVTFPLFAKTSVKGKNISPVFKYLTKKSENGLKDFPVSWNFQKFLLDRNGNLIEVFSPRTKVSEPEVIAAIEKLLING